MEKLIVLPVLFMLMVVLVSGCILFPQETGTGDQDQTLSGNETPPAGNETPPVQNETPPGGEYPDVGYW